MRLNPFSNSAFNPLRPLAQLVIVVVIVGLVGFAVAVVGAFWVLQIYGRGLPDYAQLAEYSPPVVTRLYAADGRLLSEYAIENRVFVPIGATPPLVVRAFLSAEDKGFYKHYGVEPLSVVRALWVNVRDAGQDRRLVGGSTITQQVAKNFLLTNEVTWERKIREAILSVRLEQVLTKDQILELYLNDSYFGRGAYGVAAAGLAYFGKALPDLRVEEAAYLAAVLKAPSNYQPHNNYERGLARRNWVLSRMVEDGAISESVAERAKKVPIRLSPRGGSDITSAEVFAEEVRRALVERYGTDALYGGGLLVRTTLNPRLQEIAERALRENIIAYDRRHGWRGAVRRGVSESAWRVQGGEMELPAGARGWSLARVNAVSEERIGFTLANGVAGEIAGAESLDWIFSRRSEVRPQVGDIVLVERLKESLSESASESAGESAGESGGADGMYELRQIPEVNGGLIALDPHSGRVLAMVGGFSSETSEFNRATQALRQTGSAFKPFVYLAALEQGMLPTQRILDAPFVSDQGPGLEKWKPLNYESDQFYGLTPMRVGVEKSRNLMTVRLASTIGMDAVGGLAERFGLFEDLPPYLSYALGAGEVTLADLTVAYGSLVNGGHEIKPTLIEKIQDRHGATLYRADKRGCGRCAVAVEELGSSEAYIRLKRVRGGAPPPGLAETRRRRTDSASAYQITSILEGVVQRGTGRSARDLNRPLAGKTGTSNDFVDAWFIGFSPDLVAGVYVGFDQPRSLGRSESGARAALPAWKQFMAEALEGVPSRPFRVPPDVRLRWVSAETGEAVQADTKGAILEAFKADQVPNEAGEEVLEVRGLY